MKYTIEKELTDEDLEDILATALEGGIGYWACLLNDDKDWKNSRNLIKASGETPYYNKVMLNVLKSGGTVRFQDAEDTEEGEIWNYTMDSLKQSCVKYEENYGSLIKCLEDGNFDANEADIFIQLGLFGEVIFG